MPNLSDPVAMRHPDLPGRFTITGRRSFQSHQKRGWVEAKSSEAKAAVETNRSPEGDTNPSKENES